MIGVVIYTFQAVKIPVTAIALDPSHSVQMFIYHVPINTHGLLDKLSSDRCVYEQMTYRTILHLTRVDNEKFCSILYTSKFVTSS